MKKLVSNFAVLALTGILFSCHPDPAEGNPLTMEDSKFYSSSSLSSSSLISSSSRISSSSSLRSSSSLISSSSYVSSSSLLLSSSSTLFCVIGTNCLTIGKDIEREDCWRLGTQATSCPRSSSSFMSSSSSSSACVNPPLYSSFSTVTIGEQTWMAENLNYAACSSKCYDNQESNCEKYGRLYNWATAMAVCPEGWHLPSRNEWDMLGDNSIDLKAKIGWDNSGNGEDTHGFAALPGGYGSSSIGNFNDVGSNGFWWSTGEYIYYAYSIYMNHNNELTHWNYYNKNDLFSVRCVQDFSILP
jgi:uncharacterized protein (TIGR02145 family)